MPSSMNPGLRQLTVIPLGASSTAVTRVNISIPALDAAYADEPGATLVASAEERVITRPPPSRSRYGTAARTVRNVPVRLVSTTSVQWAGSSPAAGPGRLAPALATTTSSRPCVSYAPRINSRRDSASRTSTGRNPSPPDTLAPSGARSLSGAPPGFRPAHTTRQPSLANASATTRPSPRVPPVTTATFPASLTVPPFARGPMCRTRKADARRARR
jgi:hypothetical protein